MGVDATDTARFYSCGCQHGPELEEFCKLAEAKVWQERNADTELGTSGNLTEARVRELNWQAAIARGWLVEHYGLQDRLGNYKDVEVNTLEEPDDVMDDYDPPEAY